MKLRMLSVVSIVVVLMIKSMDISAQDYNNLRLFVNAIPSDPSLVPFPLETQLDSVVYQLAMSEGVMERFVGESDSSSEVFAAYERLKAVATEEELNELLLHESPIVRIYAYRALVVNEMNLNNDYAELLVQDSTCVDWFNQDATVNTTVAKMVQQPYFD
ncbi:MAG: hypothetical protein A3D92_19230 [Bacteroidetes bacterium RIFCSPHIGHO2_02_FULL_44_7]|nr:MAG: hypothetical protein A3D92_19230 [Bacteroidetes bacterium RIFCSPHIGHO2_02_FULL_44_7]